MKKICILAAVLMMMVIAGSVQAQARAGGLPEIKIDNSIKDCGCPPCCDKAAPAPVAAPVKEKVTIALKVEFDTDKAIVKDKYYDDIKRVADFMKQYPDATATIEGHTDSVGNDEYNQELSENRADSVRQYLIEKFGIYGSRLESVGYGESRPIASNDTEEGKQRNRRVEAVLETVRIVK